VIGLFKVHVPATVDKPLLETLHSGYIGEGPRVKEFEQKIAERLGNPKVLSLNSGTSAIVLALRLAGVGPGDEVISTPMTCMATNEPILEAGAIPVWADVNPWTGLIDRLDVERKITDRTKAIIGVDWGGMPCDWEALKLLGRQHGLAVVEDAAHGLGARYVAGGFPVGGPTSPDFTVFSFQAIKHITTVDGGLLVMQERDAYERGKLLRWYGIDREGDRKDLRCEEDVLEWGYKFHMNDVAATIGIVQLDYLDGILKAQRENAAYYIENLHDWEFGFGEGFALQSSAWWLFTLLCHDAEDRERFRLYMEAQGIMASRVHVRNDVHSVFLEYRKELPGVTHFADREIAIPVHWGLSESEREQIVEAVNAYRTAGVSVPRD
jgi:perosamine synthetase